jgi:hypothetical protein
MLALERGAASMGGAVRIRRLDLTAKEVRAAAGREKDGSAARLPDHAKDKPIEIWFQML